MAERFPTLAFPPASLDVRDGDRGRMVRDPVRRAWVRLTPEEWVRQHLIHALTGPLGYPVGLLVVEREVRYLGEVRRADLVAYDRARRPLLMAECKAPGVALDQACFDQAARYNTVVQAPYLLVTNGQAHYCCRVERATGRYTFVEAIPSFSDAVGALGAAK